MKLTLAYKQYKEDLNLSKFREAAEKELKKQVEKAWKIYQKVYGGDPTKMGGSLCKALSFYDWRAFADEIYGMNLRDELIARTIIQGAHKISEVLDLRVDQVDFENKGIHFKKKGGEEFYFCDTSFIDELNEYVGLTAYQRKNSSFLFITRTGQRVARSRLNYSFARASAKCGIKKVYPEVLRATWVTLKLQGYGNRAIVVRRERSYITVEAKDEANASV